ncbi:3-beta hydroxysteroid dehydrogenase [Kroppenstedtia guangzhouensis]|uniref:3-beta hydroxysteroid dehydrogenase n=1 Tax=Kroppenstedtia guangzhouensis TaxID=1274356 RepID=A0ABQ1G102_9BACL|nr:SDR family oxidoreductase [Kroppenstedtia guangzhouensis]GGA33926.1 3-beta hydroxysteroid dehydrogenase [Kroppenstedtia guangzhouensis]
MSNQYMMTGYPGFIAGRLFRALAERDPSASFVFLVHPSQLEKARELTEAEERVRLLVGDITREGLGLSAEELPALRESITHFFHLAAIYDLAVPREAAYTVNVIGTEHVNRFVSTLKHLKRYIYFSTAYVSGNRTGIVKEDELDCGQGFKNHYEATKFEAEKRVAALKDVPCTIIRPGVVVGDSQTGETVKFDGPYFVMRFLDGMGNLPVPYVGKGSNPFNIVPVDYILKATVWLAHAEKGANRTFHLTDPSPYTAREVYRMICEELRGKAPSYTIPGKVADWLMSIPPVRKFFDVERESISYMSEQSEYDCSQAVSVLAEGGIRCPDLASYLPTLVRYYKEHREDPDKKILIR